MSLDIKTWWVNRAAAYLFAGPVVFFVFGCRDLLVGNPKDALISFLVALVIGIFYEIYLLGFRVKIAGDVLKYWRYPSLFTRPVEILRDTVMDVEHTYFGSARRLRSATIILYFSDASRSQLVMHLASFSSKNIYRLLNWLGKQ